MAIKLRNKAVMALLKEKFTPREISELFDMPISHVTTLRHAHRDMLESSLPIGSAEEYKPRAVKADTKKNLALSVLQALGPMTAKEVSEAMAEFGKEVGHSNVCVMLNSLHISKKVVKSGSHPATWSAV